MGLARSLCASFAMTELPSSKLQNKNDDPSDKKKRTKKSVQFCRRYRLFRVWFIARYAFIAYGFCVQTFDKLHVKWWKLRDID